MFSSLVSRFDVPSNRLYAAREAMQRARRPIVDLVSGNVTAQGIEFPQELLQQAFRQGLRVSRQYRPDSFGQITARRAIQRHYAKVGLDLPAAQILLTPGTSQSYWYAFKLLADAGDEILFPEPSYPLFDAIAGLCGIEMTHYKLRERERWSIDFDSMERGISERTRAIVLVSPHNPTGAVATKEEVQQLTTIAARHHVAVISDEVFAPFLHSPGRLSRPAEYPAPLVITLNGFSKMLALPGIKLGWMGVTGEPRRVAPAMKTLAMIADTFLPVSEPVQAAAGFLLERSGVFQRGYQKEIRRRAVLALKECQGLPGASWVAPEGGFYVTVNLGQRNEEETALLLLQKDGVLVHPGHFYEVSGNHLVLSLVNRPAQFRTALRRLARRLV